MADVFCDQCFTEKNKSAQAWNDLKTDQPAKLRSCGDSVNAVLASEQKERELLLNVYQAARVYRRHSERCVNKRPSDYLVCNCGTITLDNAVEAMERFDKRCRCGPDCEATSSGKCSRCNGEYEVR